MDRRAPTYASAPRSRRPPVSGAGTTPRPYWDRAFLQSAGFAVGRALSSFDIFYLFGTYIYISVRVQGDTNRTGQNRGPTQPRHGFDAKPGIV